MLKFWSRATHYGTCNCASKRLPTQNLFQPQKRHATPRICARANVIRYSTAAGDPSLVAQLGASDIGDAETDERDIHKFLTVQEKTLDEQDDETDLSATQSSLESTVSGAEQFRDTRATDLLKPSRLGPEISEWPANTGLDLVRTNLPPQSLWAPEATRLKAMRRRHTWKKLAMQRLSTGLLIHDLLRQVNLQALKKTEALESASLTKQMWEVIHLSKEQSLSLRTEIQTSIEKLQGIDVDTSPEQIRAAGIKTKQPLIPVYRQDPDGDFHLICRHMNEGITRLLDGLQKGDVKEQALTIAKICHNLLVSMAPPDVQTFNILISGFKRLRKSSLVDLVVQTLDTQKIRPNEITCHEILNYYTLESRPEDFSRYVARMRGMANSLVLANPNITINEASQNRLVRFRKNKVLQKIYPTPMVLGALINGVLKFAGFDRALDIYYEMKADGWGLDLPGLTLLLEDCIARADWTGGLYLWEEIDSIKFKAPRRDLTRAYSRMLSLCSVCTNTIAFNHILKEVARGKFNTKRIVQNAERITMLAPRQPTFFPPPFTADNVSIAVSSYVKSRGQAVQDEDDEDDVDDDMFSRKADAIVHDTEAGSAGGRGDA